MLSTVVEPERVSSDLNDKSRKGAIMKKRSETTPVIVKLASANTWRPHLFRAAYIGASAVAMFGWTIALSWAALSLVRLFV
jgi:hypothetical protein